MAYELEVCFLKTITTECFGVPPADCQGGVKMTTLPQGGFDTVVFTTLSSSMGETKVIPVHLKTVLLILGCFAITSHSILWTRVGDGEGTH